MSYKITLEVYDNLRTALPYSSGTKHYADHMFVRRLCEDATQRRSVQDAVDLLSRGTEHRSLDKFVAGYGTGR
jgi:hypothetical protein